MEKKKKAYVGLMIAVVIIGLLVYTHHVPLWASVSNMMCVGVGMVVGWSARILYSRYVTTTKG